MKCLGLLECLQLILADRLMGTLTASEYLTGEALEEFESTIKYERVFFLFFFIDLEGWSGSKEATHTATVLSALCDQLCWTRLLCHPVQPLPIRRVRSLRRAPTPRVAPSQLLKKNKKKTWRTIPAYIYIKTDTSPIITSKTITHFVMVSIVFFFSSTLHVITNACKGSQRPGNCCCYTYRTIISFNMQLSKYLIQIST